MASIKAKDLTYDKREPAFLKRLREQQSGFDQPSNSGFNARPRKPRLENEEDEPAYVVEGTNEVLSKADYDALVEGKPSEDSDSKEITEEGVQERKDTEQDAGDSMKTAIGNARKRKLGKVVGNEDETADDHSKVTKPKKVKQKQKQKVKLSFDEE